MSQAEVSVEKVMKQTAKIKSAEQLDCVILIQEFQEKSRFK